ncbi:MAG: hypothetical protein HY313_10415 [Acidobacteria bacterium]|nr:hypothetical protein [Acidobacteriota bacterium]
MSDIAIHIGAFPGAYPERMEPPLRWLDRAGSRIASPFFRWHRKGTRGQGRFVDAVTEAGEWARRLGVEELRAAAAELGQQLRRSGFPDPLVARSFALVREAAERTVGQRHFDVQLVGGRVLLRGMVAEMETGEGKTLTATLAAATAALAGVPVHIITVNDYLANRDAEWMRPVYQALGLTVGTIIHGLDPDARRAQYRSDITYCTNKEIAFDYLKDRIVLGRNAGRVQLQVERLYEKRPRLRQVADGNDTVQIGQVFDADRTAGVITNIAEDDVFETIEITRGWLSNGVSVATTVNGGTGNDEFTVFHNVGELSLNGGDGDDFFTVRAFALAGSTDSERGRTDMKGDAGADTILYAMNAPVGIDGGDGFDTVRIIGTEFSDDFVVTDHGVFGAGLSVNYVNIEKLVMDGAEGDDRFFVLSTALGSIVQIEGGLGSDSFFVGGSPGGAPISVVSDDFKGHSGVILHDVESSDTDYDGIAVDGVSANIADNEEDFIIVTESGGVSKVKEGTTSGGEGWEYDTYTVRLSRAPDPGKSVIINLVPAGLPPEDEAKGFQDLEFYDPANLNNLLPYNPTTGKQVLPVLTFTSADWNVAKTIKFKAKSDTASEGTRFTFIGHTTSNSTDPQYQNAKPLTVKVQMDDDDRAAVIVRPTGRDNTVLEGGFTDSYEVLLGRQPTAPVTVQLSMLNNQLVLSTTTLVFSPNAGDANAWNKPQTITVTARDDEEREGFHTEYISYQVTSGDADVAAFRSVYKLDGDLSRDVGSDGLADDIPAEKPVSFLFLTDRPILNDAAKPVQVLYDADGSNGPGGEVALTAYTGQNDSTLRYMIVGNTLEFFKSGKQIAVSGSVRVSYYYLVPGYNNIAVTDSVVDIYDNDAAAVIVTQTDGSTDVLEGGFGDTYSVVLSKKPTDDVTVTIDAVNTRTTLNGVARFQPQMEVSLDGINFSASVEVTFTVGNWNSSRTIFVRAIDDAVQDGSETQVFAPEAHTVNKIRGGVVIEGATGAGGGSLSLPVPLMLPGEINRRPSDGGVAAFVAGNGAGALELMTVNTADLQTLIDDPTKEFDSFADFIGKTLQLTEGPGTGVVRDPSRPQELFNRFWLITAVQDIAGDPAHKKLTLQNPSVIDPASAGMTAPTAASKYAITALSVNFFADERQEVDLATIYDEDSVANDVGRLTSADGAVLAFDATTNKMTVAGDDLQAVRKLLGLADVSQLVGRSLTVTVGPGVGATWLISTIVDGAELGTKVLTLTAVAAGGGLPNDRSEFRIEGGDRRGRITGFGMGPNVLGAGALQPGGITYSDIEVMAVNLGSGNDNVIVDYTTNAEDHTTKRTGDYYTLTMLNMGGGNDSALVNLKDGEDGALVLDAQGGNDTVDGSGSTLGLVVFGGEGDDTINGGSGEDVIFGDIGRLDYIDSTGEIITRLGHSVPQSPVNAPVASRIIAATATTLTDSAANFQPGSLQGFTVQVVSSAGTAQLATITSNTATEITVAAPWETTPDSTFFYRILFSAADETIDGVIRATLTDPLGNFETNYGGLVGLMLQVIAPDGHVQFRRVIANTATKLILDHPWDTLPVTNGATPQLNFFYRIASYPEDQTDGVIRGPQIVWSVNNELGGKDKLYGGAGKDILIGGASDDQVFGGADNDWIAGDNARFDFEPVSGNDGAARITLIQTTGVNVGGGDTISGDAGADIILGGASGDTLYGDNATASSGASDLGEVILGDNGRVVFLGGILQTIQTTDNSDATGGADTIHGHAGADVILGGAAGDTIFGDGGEDWVLGDNGVFEYGVDGTLATLDLVQTSDPNVGGGDTVFGGSERDVILGGTGNDTVHGNTGADVILGDQGEVILIGGRISRIDDMGGVGDDSITGDEDADLIVGGLGNDTIHGNTGTDIIVGDAARVLLGADGVTVRHVETITRLSGGIDTIWGDDQDDVLIGGTNSDNLDGGLGQDLVFGDNVLLVLSAGSGNAINPRFRSLTGTAIYDAEGNPLVGVAGLLPPGGNPAWSDWTITLDQSLNPAQFGDDYIAGGGGNDEIFGQLGNDTIQGDGSIDGKVLGGVPVGAFRGPAGLLEFSPTLMVATNGLLTVVPSFEAPTDGDDAIFGNLGQDDIIGGNSSLFSLTNAGLRPDGSDLIFGGAGTDISRNDAGDASTIGHAQDADMILGDNGNIYRLVGINGTNLGAYLTFNYDNYGVLRIIPRAGELLDYTPGGPDFNPGAAATDIGAADEIHGESGDDFIYGMKGNDVLFGEGQDDDVIGGYGNDWISAGTGNDGVLGDDGRIYTSRNGATEPLNRLDAANAEEAINTPGNTFQATIFPTGQLNKTVEMTPFSVDPAWNATTDEFGGGLNGKPHGSDDVIYGGLGNDFLHSGAGDDAVSGAEALSEFYAQPANPGDVLGYMASIEEFRDYDEFAPLAKISPFFLNFGSDEGPAVVLGGFAPVNTDGNDMIFGDLGNDWLVGGTGNDHLYGGWGSDLLNGDDDLETDGGANTAPDSNPSYQDITFGGAGRDVIIGNTGGDRLVDWIGEFNSYVVPFSPFGLFTITRLVQPRLPDFLYALSEGDGADRTLGADVSRNGEPAGELGLILQQDPAWQNQSGAPADPQPGNLSSQKRDILGKETFEAALTNFAASTGAWSISSGTYVAAPSTTADSISLYQTDQLLPNDFEIKVTANVEKTGRGQEANSLPANGYVIFDYQSPTDFKFAGINIAAGEVEIGHRTAQGWVVDAKAAAKLQENKDIDLKLILNGPTVKLEAGDAKISFTFADFTGDGMLGLAARNSNTKFDDWQIQKPPAPFTFTISADFSNGSVNPFTAQSGVWQMANGVYVGTSGGAGGSAISTRLIDVIANSQLNLQASINPGTAGVLSGFVFDFVDPTNYKFVGIVAGSNQVVVGHNDASGSVIDATATTKMTRGGTNTALAISLSGSKLTVSVDGAEIITKSYYSVINDGAIGLLSRNGSTAFDNVLIQGDDPAYSNRTVGRTIADMPSSLFGGLDLPAVVTREIARVMTERQSAGSVSFSSNNVNEGSLIDWDSEASAATWQSLQDGPGFPEFELVEF